MINEELKNLVREHKHIDKVYFAKSGKYYLSPVQYKDALFGTVVNDEPIKETLIIEIVERDVILNDVKSENTVTKKTKK